MATSPVTLPLSIICNVTINISPQAVQTPGFNQALIVGPSTVIPSQGANSRIRQYTALTQMTTDGFTSAMPEFIAAQLYFGQTPTPQILWVGRQDGSALKTVAVGAAAGTSYVVGDVLTVTQSGASAGTVKVSTIGAGGSITGLTLQSGGTGYSVATGLATTGGSGSGAQVNITAIGETPLAALQACRAVNSQWWACMVCNVATADVLLIAPWIQSVTPSGCFFFTTQDASAPAGSTSSVFAQLQTGMYSRVFGIYSTTQGGTYPNNAYAAAAVMGVAMGMNTGLANSFFTMKFRVLTGVTTEPLTQTQVTAVEGQNGNLYLSYSNTYGLLEQGKVSDGQFLDEVLNLDMLASDIQYTMMDLLVSVPSVPMTDQGEGQLIAAVDNSCERARVRGFIDKGIWQGQTVLNVTQGTSLPLGYKSQAQSYQLQSQGDRAARKAMPIYTTIIEAEAVHFITIGVYVQR